MAENVETLVPEQLRPIRDALGRMESRIDGLPEDVHGLRTETVGLEAKIDGNTAILVGFGHYIHSIDVRVEHLERKIGGPA